MGIGRDRNRTKKYRGDEHLQNVVMIAATVLFLLFLARRIMSNHDIARRYGSVLKAYAELEAKNQQVLDRAAQLEQRNDELEAVKAELIRNNRQLVESKTLWEQLAITDMMTEIANHRAFQERLREEIARAQRYNYPFILLMLDVDHFKQYNDTHGHPSGDRVLRRIASVMRETVREGDLVARYGGEEFAALLPQTDAGQGRIVAERIREAVERHPFAHRTITMSIGAAEFAVDGGDAETLISSADRALYTAKHEGRNCVVFVQDTEPTKG